MNQKETSFEIIFHLWIQTEFPQGLVGVQMIIPFPKFILLIFDFLSSLIS